MQKNQHTSSTKEEDQRPQADSFHWLTAADTRTWLEEHDACSLVAAIRKNGEATHGNLKRALAALSIMGHRSGEVNGEGDGVGVLTDIPRLLWSQALEQEGKPGWLAEDRRFFVGHLMIPNTEPNVMEIQASILSLLQTSGIDLLLDRPVLFRTRRWLFLRLGALAAAVAVAAVVGLGTWRGFERAPELVVLNDTQNALRAPLASATPQFPLPEGSLVRAREYRGEWVRVSYGQLSGWIRRAACAPVLLAAPP